MNLFRPFRRFPSVSIINLTGLSAALACVLLIYVWVADELAVDRYHGHSARLFRVLENDNGSGTLLTTAHTSEFLAQALENELPEVEAASVATPSHFFPPFTLQNQGRFFKTVGKFASQEYIKMFSWHFLQGDTLHALDYRNNIVISQSLAERMFRTAGEALGKSISWQMANLTRVVTVTGVFRDLSSHASEHFDFILPFDSFKELMGSQQATVNWNESGPFETFILLKPNNSKENIDDKLGRFLKTRTTTSRHRTLFVQYFSDGYLYGKFENGVVAGGRIDYIALFSTIAIFILAIACINFMNLSTAQAAQRIKEIGIRKTVGASRRTLITLFLRESMLMVVMAFACAAVVTWALLPSFSLLTGKMLSLTVTPGMAVVALSLIVITTFMAGAYPAVYLSKFSPAKALQRRISSTAGEQLIRKGLVIFQFSVSVVLIVALIVVTSQIRFVQTKSPGLDLDNVVTFEAEGPINLHTDAAIAALRNIPGVVNASSMLGSLYTEVNGIPDEISVGDRKVAMGSTLVNYDFLETLGIQLKEGRSFRRDFGSDNSKIILNEAAVEALGLTDPVGKIVAGREVIGVVKNFHFQSLHENIHPSDFILDPSASTSFIVKLQSGSVSETMNAIKKLYQIYNAGFEFSWQFLDQAYQAQYIAEKRVAELAGYFAALAIFLSCLGLFGLSAFTTERRSKEIGVRKVLGSSVAEVILLLTGEFTRMVVVGVIIGIPVSYYVTVQWLSGFAYHIPLQWYYFSGAGAAALITAWLTVSIQTLKAATANPVDALRAE